MAGYSAWKNYENKEYGNAVVDVGNKGITSALTNNNTPAQNMIINLVASIISSSLKDYDDVVKSPQKNGGK